MPSELPRTRPLALRPQERRGGGSPAHRLVLEAKVGRSITGWHAHNSCGKAECIEPDHLVPATARANVAEMLARSTYEAEIATLRAALAELAPAHPLLAGHL